MVDRLKGCTGVDVANLVETRCSKLVCLENESFQFHEVSYARNRALLFHPKPVVLPSWWGDGQTQIWVLGVLANGLAKASLVISLERCVTMVAISILGLIIVYRQYSNK